MKKPIICLLLIAFVSFGAFAVHKVSASITPYAFNGVTLLKNIQTIAYYRVCM